jgi:hypothetical protein
MVGDGLLWVSADALQHTNGEGTSLTSTRLSLGNCVLALDQRQDALGLNGGRVLKTIAIDATQYVLLQTHIVKLINFQVPVRFEILFSLAFQILVSTPEFLVFGLLDRSLLLIRFNHVRCLVFCV